MENGESSEESETGFKGTICGAMDGMTKCARAPTSGDNVVTHNERDREHSGVILTLSLTSARPPSTIIVIIALAVAADGRTEGRTDRQTDRK